MSIIECAHYCKVILFALFPVILIKPLGYFIDDSNCRLEQINYT